MISSTATIWSTQWRGVDISVFATGDGSLSAAGSLTLLNDEEQSRAARFHFPADRDRWMRSRALLRMSLAQRLGVDARAIAFRCGPNGKPELQEQAAVPLRFNLSHSGDYVAVAISAEQVGVDLEQWEGSLPVIELAEHEFRPDESAAISESAEPHLLFYRLWTAKEAVMKCTGFGLSLPPASIIVRGSSGTAHRIDADEKFDIFAHSAPGAWTLSAATRSFPLPA